MNFVMNFVMENSNCSLISLKNDEHFNGLFIKGNYIPEELLSELFCYIDYKQLLLCHLVCKKWNSLIKKYVWQRKAACNITQKNLVNNSINIPWISFYYVCAKKPFNRNLLLSENVEVSNAQTFSGELEAFTEIELNNSQILSSVIPLPDDLLFETEVKAFCLADVDYLRCKRKVHINLKREGFTENILDDLQPIIKVNLWYCCQWEQENANFECIIKLLKNQIIGNYENKIMRVQHYSKNLKNSCQRGKWLNYSCEFKQYGKGLRSIKFYHGGKHKAIMAGASIKLVLPTV